MKIALACKLDDNGDHGFIKPLADIKAVEKICVFRDVPGLSGDKVEYSTPKIRKPALLAQISGKFSMRRPSW